MSVLKRKQQQKQKDISQKIKSRRYSISGMEESINNDDDDDDESIISVKSDSSNNTVASNVYSEYSDSSSMDSDTHDQYGNEAGYLENSMTDHIETFLAEIMGLLSSLEYRIGNLREKKKEINQYGRSIKCGLGRLEQNLLNKENDTDG
nr:MAG: hypothetical protein [Marsupenaeus japonicus endogenous nimavirus]